jgi:spore germination protein
LEPWVFGEKFVIDDKQGRPQAMSTRRWALPVALILFAGLFWGSASAEGQGSRPPDKGAAVRYHSWPVYWDNPAGEAALTTVGPALTEIGIFAYHFNDADQLVPATPWVDGKLVAARAAGPQAKPRMLITFVNDWMTAAGVGKLKDPIGTHRVLATLASRAAHIAEILRVCEGLSGAEIDYERLDPQDRDGFSAFIHDLAEALHQRGQRLAVIVQPRSSTTKPDDKNGAGTIDWASVGRDADEVKIMAYLYSYPGSLPGSVAPTWWLRNLVTYAKSVLPAEKLAIILHLGGFDWPEGGPGKAVEYPQAAALAAAKGVTLQHQSEPGAASFRYTDDQGKGHVVWVEDAAGLRDKVAVLREAGVASIGLWRLGTGDPTIWQALKAQSL